MSYYTISLRVIGIEYAQVFDCMPSTRHWLVLTSLLLELPIPAPVLPACSAKCLCSSYNLDQPLSVPMLYVLFDSGPNLQGPWQVHVCISCLHTYTHNSIQLSACIRHKCTDERDQSLWVFAQCGAGQG
jgi:hypothetical protein